MVFAKSATLRTFGEEFFFPFIKKETIQIVFGVKNFDFTTSVFFWTLYLTSGRYDFTGEVFSMHAVNGLWWCFFFVTFFFLHFIEVVSEDLGPFASYKPFVYERLAIPWYLYAQMVLRISAEKYTFLLTFSTTSIKNHLLLLRRQVSHFLGK